MWLKLIGVVFVIGSCGSWGLIGSRRVRQRIEQIKDLRLGLNYLEKEITCMYTPLSLAMKNTAGYTRYPVCVFFGTVAESLKNEGGMVAAEAWQFGITKLRQAAQLKDEELQFLESLSGQIGASNSKEQQKCLDLISEQLKIIEEKCQTNMDSSQKLWTYGGFILGAIMVLLLI